MSDEIVDDPIKLTSIKIHEHTPSGHTFPADKQMGKELGDLLFYRQNVDQQFLRKIRISETEQNVGIPL